MQDEWPSTLKPPAAGWWKLPVMLAVAPVLAGLGSLVWQDPAIVLKIPLFMTMLPFVLLALAAPGFPYATAVLLIFLSLRWLMSFLPALVLTHTLTVLGLYLIFLPGVEASPDDYRRRDLLGLAILAQYPTFVLLLTVQRAFLAPNRKSP